MKQATYDQFEGACEQLEYDPRRYATPRNATINVARKGDLLVYTNRTGDIEYLLEVEHVVPGVGRVTLFFSDGNLRQSATNTRVFIAKRK